VIGSSAASNRAPRAAVQRDKQRDVGPARDLYAVRARGRSAGPLDENGLASTSSSDGVLLVAHRCRGAPRGAPRRRGVGSPGKSCRRPSLPPEYTFVPWLRRGVAAEIAQDDTLGSDPNAGPLGRATMPVELTLSTVAVPRRHGPGRLHDRSRHLHPRAGGDVADIRKEAILRTQPVDGAAGVHRPPVSWPYVEFYDEDFPWRYTPARAKTSAPAPWLALLVLTDASSSRSRRPSEELPV
jgi:hypothetical protein